MHPIPIRNHPRFSSGYIPYFYEAGLYRFYPIESPATKSPEIRCHGTSVQTVGQG